MRELTPEQARRQRWLAIAALAATATSTHCLFLAFVPEWHDRLMRVPAWTLLPMAVLGLFVCSRFAARRWCAFLGLRHPVAYPPVWVAAALGTAILLVGLATVERLHRAVPLGHELGRGLLGCAAIILTSTAFLLLAAEPASPPEGSAATPRSDEPQPSRSAPASFEEIVNWVRDDAPLTTSAKDRFGHLTIARRIATRLTANPVPSQAVVGAFGAGKTSLRHLVAEALTTLDPNEEVRIIPVELWQYDSPGAAVEGAIRTIIRGVAQEVNVLAVRRLPKQYVRGMTTLGGLGEAVADLFDAHDGPFKELEKLDHIALAIDKRFVVWVDDLERFAGQQRSESLSDVPNNPEAERLNPIRALLHALDHRLSAFSVITATTNLHTRIDVEKGARFVERIPELPPEDVGKLLRSFREGCRAQHPNDIDPAAPEAREELQDLGNPISLDVRRRYDHKRAVDLLPELMRTPRALKHGLRAVYETWSQLHGEIDFDDLLVVSLLRSADHEAFALLEAHLPELRTRADRHSGGREDQDSFDNAAAALLKSAFRTAAAQKLAQFVFSSENSVLKPQGLHDRRYWERFSSGAIGPGTDRDQPVLELILSARDDDLLDLLESSRSGQFEAFQHLISSERVLSLLVPLVRRRSEESAAAWLSDDAPFDRRIPGLIPLWRCWLARHGRGEISPQEVFEKTIEALEIAARRNLLLTADLEHYFAGVGSDRSMLHGTPRSDQHPQGPVNETKKYVRRKVVALYAGHPAKLVHALRGAVDPTLLWICWGLDRVREGRMTGLPFPGWESLARTTLDATVLEPEVMMVQVAPLVVTWKMAMAQGREYSFDERQAANLFGSAEALLSVVRGLPRGEWSQSPSMRPLLEAATQPVAAEEA